MRRSKRKIRLRELPDVLRRLGDQVVPQMHRELVREIAEATLETAVDVSPVGGEASRRRWGKTGTYKASHRVALGAPNLDGQANPRALQGIRLGVPAYVGSAARHEPGAKPYSPWLEPPAAKSPQAPRGVYSLAVPRVLRRRRKLAEKALQSVLRRHGF